MNINEQRKMTLEDQIAYYLKSTGNRIAASIRIVTTSNPDATRQQMIAAGVSLGLNAKTVGSWFCNARAEDARLEKFFNQP